MLRMGGAIPPPLNAFKSHKGTTSPFLLYITSFMRGVKLWQIDSNVNMNVIETDKYQVEWGIQIE